MAKVHGSKGVITLGGLAGIQSFSLDKQSDPLDTTVMGSTTKTFIAGARSFTIECSAISAAPATAESYSAANTLKSFEINGSAEAIDVSAIGNIGADSLPFKSFIGGLPEWDASLEIDMDAGTPPPASGSAYTFAGASAIVQSCGYKNEANGVISYSLSIKGTGALPAALTTTPGGSAAFEVITDADYIASGNVIVTAFKISGSIGGLVTFAISGQGTGELIETDPEA